MCLFYSRTQDFRLSVTNVNITPKVNNCYSDCISYGSLSLSSSYWNYLHMYEIKKIFIALYFIVSKIDTENFEILYSTVDCIWL